MPATIVLRTRRQAARLGVFSVLACGVVCVCVPSGAHASGRFGDSTWVAPGVPFDSEFTTGGPRVAPPDYERRWETALRAPFRLAFFPLRLLAKGLEASADYVGPRFFAPEARRPPSPGPTLTSHFTQGSGLNDVGIGPAIEWNGVPTDDFKLRLSGTWSPTDRRRVRFTGLIGDGRPVSFRLRGDFDRKPNRRYYGIGNDTPETNLSYFLLARSDAEAALRFGAAPLRQLRVLVGVSSMSPSRAYNAEPLLEDAFASSSSAPFARQTTQELWYGIAGDLASLDDGRDPSRGAHGRFDLRRATGVRSRDPDYSQWRVEGRAYVPVFAKRRVIAVRGVYAGVEPSGDDTPLLPYYRLAQTEDVNRFAGFSTARFRDRRLMLGRVEYRWQIFRRVSAIALYELGEVAPRTRSFTLRDAHESYGGGLRLGLSDTHTVRFELATSEDGPHARLALGGDF